jgi:hypothetical protein
MNITDGNGVMDVQANTSGNLNKKSKPGRAARRRKAKERSINEALDQLLSGNNSSLTISSHDSALPSDRSESLASVVSLRNKLNVNFEDDERRLVSQLGFFPGNAITISSRVVDLKDTYPHLHSLLLNNKMKHVDVDCAEQDKYPTTLQLYPLAIRNVHLGGKQGRKYKSRKRGHDGNSVAVNSSDENSKQKPQTLENSTVLEPFPTMYWLTHPILRVLISRIELGDSDNVMEMERRLSSSQSNLLQMQRAHESYGRARWDLLTEDDTKDVMQRKWNDAIGTCKGVAGIKRYQTIKCLHTHAAHYLATMNKVDENDENIVGRWVMEVVERQVQNMKDD